MIPCPQRAHVTLIYDLILLAPRPGYSGVLKPIFWQLFWPGPEMNCTRQNLNWLKYLIIGRFLSYRFQCLSMCCIYAATLLYLCYFSWLFPRIDPTKTYPNNELNHFNNNCSTDTSPKTQCCAHISHKCHMWYLRTVSKIGFLKHTSIHV